MLVEMMGFLHDADPVLGRGVVMIVVVGDPVVRSARRADISAIIRRTYDASTHSLNYN